MSTWGILAKNGNFKKKQVEMLKVKVTPEVKNPLTGLNSTLDIVEERNCNLGNRSKETTRGNTKGKNSGEKST